MSGDGVVGRPRRHLLRVLPAVLAAPMALLVAGVLVRRAAGGGGEPPIGIAALGLLIVAVLVLALVGALAAWRNHRRHLWGTTGGLLVLGMLPFGLAPHILLVALLVGLGAMNTTLDRRWYDIWFTLAMLVPLWGIGALLVTYLPGHSAVMVAVGGAIVFGASVSVVAVTTGSISPPSHRNAGQPACETADRRLIRRHLAGVARGPSWRIVWFVVVAWSIIVSALHFGGLSFRLYTQYWWWDVLTHGMSGFGVAAIVYLLRPAAFTTARRLFVLLPAVVLIVGAGFEVYEFLFTSFYHSWTPERYLTDTRTDLIVDTAGAVVFALFPYTRSIGRGDLKPGP